MHTTNEIIKDLQNGKMVILVDDEDRENEGDLVVAADFISSDHINFMAKYGRGLICLTLTEKKCNQLKSDRTPQEAGMKLSKKPVKPNNSALRHAVDIQPIWGIYLW
jgi:3,4-dihydroxy-2-butanone 4-phosphate synthase